MLNGLSMGAGALDLTAAQQLIDAASDSKDLGKAEGTSRRKGHRASAANKYGQAGMETGLKG